MSDLLYILCFFSIFVHSIYEPKLERVLLGKHFKIIYIMLFSLMIGMLLGLFKSFNPIESTGYFLQYTFIFLILLPVLVYLIEDFKYVLQTLSVYVLAAAPVIILVTLSSFGLFNGVDYIIRAGGGRYVGFNAIATSFGLYMCYIFIIAVILFFYMRLKVEKLLFLGISIGAIYCIILSISFSAMILLTIGLGLIMLILIKRNTILQLLSIFVFAVSLLVLLLFYFDKVPLNFYNYLPDSVLMRLEKSDGEIGSSNLRMELNKQAVEKFMSSPLLGVGENQFRYYNYEARNVHNTILSTAVETGIFGLIGVLIYLCLPLYSIRKIKYYLSSNIKINFLVDGLLILAMMRICQTAFSGPYIQREAWIPILLILAIAFNIKYFKKEIQFK